MPFLNLDDNFAEHLKVDGLTDSAFRLHVAGLCHCARLMTDGYIEGSKVSRLVPRFKKSSLEELLRGGLWLKAVGGYQVHDYLDWNRSKAEIEEKKEKLRKARSEAGKKGADKRWHSA